MTSTKLSEVIGPAFYDVHKAIKDESIHEVVLAGGRGSLKSSCAGTEIPLILERKPDCHALVLRKYANTLRNSVFAQIKWSIGKLGLSGQYTFTLSPMEITKKSTGQKIFFFGLDDPQKIKSIKVPFGHIGVLWFEEADQFSGPEEMRNVEQSTFRGGDYSMEFKSFNPPAMARNWMNQYAGESAPRRMVHHSTYLQAPKEWLGQRFFDDAEQLQQTNPTAYRHEYLGEVVGCGTQVFENLRLEPISESKRKSFGDILSGVDWGWYPDCWAFNRIYYDAPRRTLYIFDELTRLKTRNADTAQLVKARIPASEIVICDSAEEKSVGDYRDYGIRARASVKGPGSVARSMKWLQSLSAIVIDPACCPDTAKEFSEYEYERDKAGTVLGNYPDAANHHIDAVRYATNNIWLKRGAQ